MSERQALALAEPESTGERLPLSAAQRGLWLFSQLHPTSPLYNLSQAWWLRGPLYVGALEQALAALVRRHEALRTAFLTGEAGEPCQLVCEPLPVPLRQVELGEVAAEHREAEALRLAEAEAQAPFTLSRAPLLRGLLIQLEPQVHLLVLTTHHIVADGWSVGVLVRELSALYEAHALGQPAHLAPLPLQYGDFALWQQELLSGERLQALQAWWAERLRGLEPLELPVDKARPPVMSFRGGTVPVSLPAELSERLRALARQEGATPFTLLLAAFAVLLGRYSGQEEFAIGSASAGRTQEELEPLIGCFANVLVLRVNLRGEPSFRELLRRVRQVSTEALEHQDMPFELLVEQFARARDLSRPPLAQALFTWQGAGGAALALPGLSAEELLLRKPVSRGELFLSLGEEQGRLQGLLEYSGDLFEASTAERLAGHYQVLLEGLVAEPSRPVGRLPLVVGPERQRLLREWGGASAMHPAGACLHELFEAQVERTPEAVAVTCEGQALTYRELEERANRLAHALRRRGVGPEVLVGLCVARSLDLVVGLLAILKAGGAYLPLDPDYPRERLAFMLEDSRAPVLLTHARHAAALGLQGPHVLCMDGDAEQLAAEPASRLPRAGGPECLAYVIYTSGSTGRPKGALVTHHNVVRLFEVSQGLYGFGPGDVWSVFHSYAFDFSVWELWGALLYGGRAVVVPYWVSRSPEAFYRLLVEERVTVLNQTPSAFRQLVRAEESLGEAARAGLALRYVIFGGEALELGDLRPWWERHGDERPRLVNMYGITETTVHVTFRPLGLADLERPRASLVGRPLPDLSVYVLDRHLQPVPTGVPGEVYVGGAGVARGYLGRPELTAERFVPDCLSGESGARLYRTGDRARWLPGGELEYLGRVDLQVKLRGFRIELGEIEAALEQHPGVREAAVVLREDAPGDKRLVAYVVPAGPAPTAAELRGALTHRLPEYMVPAAFVPLEALPLTHHGKLDRRALPAPVVEASAQGEAAPRTRTEQLLAELFAQVLHLEHVGVEADFFALGGHSLLATQLAARLRSALGVELPLRMLFEAPTVRALAARLEAPGPQEGAPRPPPLERAERTGPLPLSFAQQRMWFIDQLEPGSTLYNLPVLLRLRGVLDTAALERGLAELVRRHEVLRTTFPSESGQPLQSIHPPAPVPLPSVDLGALAEPEREAEALRLATQEALRPFELGRDLPLRALLLRLGEREHVLVVSLHHIASDGWSLGVLVRELTALYEAASLGRASPLPELPLQYADYALWQRDWLRGEVLEQQLGYWRQQLAGVAALELPTDKPRPSVQSFRGATVPVLLPRPLLERLTALCQREGLTPFMLLLAAWQALLHRYTGQEDIAVGCPVSGRGRSELEGLIGLFVNTLVLRSQVRPDTSFRELLAHVKERALGAFAHQEVPFERLVEELRPERDTRRSPLFQVMFSLQNAPLPEVELPGLRLSLQGLENPSAPFDLSLALREEPEGLRGTLEYCVDLFERSTVERMAGHLRVLLEGALATPEARLGALPLLTEAERHQVVVDFNATATEYPADTCLHTLVERQAALRPHSVAVEFQGQRLTYAQLDSRSNQLAHLLRLHGVGPDVPVALCLERSLELIVSLLAILKAGGAYVPLDSSYPSERLALMLEDTRPALLLTTRALSHRLGSLTSQLPCLCLEEVDLEPLPTSPVHSGASSRNLAYVVFTSGSTGRPKGVAIEHRSVLRLLHSPHYAHLGPEETLLLSSPISFDASVFEVWGALAYGARLVVFPPESPTDLELLCRVLADSGVTTVFFTSSFFSQLVDFKLQGLRGLRQLLTGGDVISAHHVRTALEQLPTSIIACYGPTETTVFASCWPLTAPHQVGSSIPLGRPLANTQVYLLDEHAQPVPIGVPGELYIGGPGLARGYQAQPALTAERFVPHPFSSTPGERLYRTGDLARWREDGVLEFLGRSDSQVKVRGFRVEPGEIEAVLVAHPSVREAVVVARQEGAGDKRLVGYVVPRQGYTLDLAELRTFLQQRLPDYLRPSALVALPSLPLTPNAKVDRKALPAPEPSHPQGEYSAPQGELEERLASVWARLLGVERIGREDDFFECGGHSLLAIRLVARLREELGLELGVREIFEAPTVAGQARRLAQQARTEPQPPLAPTSEALVLSLAQEQLWFLQQLEPESPAYNIPLGFRLTGPLEAEALGAAFRALCERHEALRTVFPAEEGHPRPRLLSTLALERRACESPRELERQLYEEVHRPFELSRGPLVRAVLFRLSEQQHVLLLVLHHLVADGWSVGVLLSELGALYPGEGAELPPLRLRYAEHAAWQREHLQGAELERLLAYWREQLAGLAALELPVDKPRPALLGWRGASLPVRLSPEVTEALSALCRQQGATLFMGLLAALSALLGRYTGEEDIAVSTPVAGRTRPGTEGLVGPLLNTLILRLRLGGEPSFVELLRRARAVCLGAYEHQEVPLDRLVQALAPVREPSRAPFTPVALQLQNLPERGLALSGLRVEPLELEPDTTQAELILTLHPEADGGLGGTLTFSTELFEASTMERLRGHWLRLVEGLVRRPHERVGALPLLAEQERQKLLEEWSGRASSPPPEACLHELFSAQAARTPEATAVLFEDTALSYAELERKANQVAWHLRRLGAGPEVLVGLCVERSLEMVVGLLGILKAGAAYVPLDPSYPPERLAVLVEDSRLGLLLTQRRLLPRLPRHEARCVLLEEQELAREPEHVPPSPVTPDNLAYTLFTSGSTGRPKGVMVAHRGVVNHCLAVARAFELGPGDRFLQFFSLSFDGSVEELFPTWLRGAAVVLMPWHVPESLGAFTRLLERQRVTVAEVPTAWWHLWSEALASGEGRLPEALRLVAVAGEAAQPTALAQWNRAVGERVAWCNTYGPTEATVTTTLYGPRGRERALEERLPPLGEPIENVRVYVLDARLEPVPVGVLGELYIGGAGVSRGYLGRPELTAERFLPSPFGGGGERLYRTGDRVRWLEGGRLEFRGRMDAQVKIRGFRIEPGEVEAVLSACPGVRQAAVVDRENGRGERYLAAYVVPGEPRPTPGALRALLEERLPAYMVPSRLVLLEALPLNANGKVERRALPEPEATAGEHGYVAPRSTLEATLARLWESVLGVESVSVEDNFFELGGHSLLMMEVLARVEQHLGRAVPLSAMLRHPTVAGLAEHLGGRLEPGRWSPCVLLRRGQGSRPPLFLVHPANGGVLGYARLVRHLARQQPVYGLQAPGLEEGQQPLRRMGDLVELYLEGMREVRPRGPYALGGFSAGVPLAYELAWRLEQAGEEVALVVDLDGSAPQQVREEVDPDTSEAELLAVWFEQYREELGEPPQSGLREALGRMSPEQQQAALLAEMKRVNVVPAGAGLPTVRALLETSLALASAFASYVPRGPVRAPVLSLRACNPAEPTAGPALVERWRQLWRELTRGPVHVELVPATHVTLMREPALLQVASSLERYLEALGG